MKAKKQKAKMKARNTFKVIFHLIVLNLVTAKEIGQSDIEAAKLEDIEQQPRGSMRGSGHGLRASGRTWRGPRRGTGTDAAAAKASLGVHCFYIRGVPKVRRVST